MTGPAHPRSCGADVTIESAEANSDGSSPLVRGGPDHLERDARRLRLIPARAGRTNPPRPTVTSCPAHPRSCGADGGVAAEQGGDRGSSPLVRGGLDHCFALGPVGRLIPARAGRTGWRHRHRSRISAHPRSCGADLGLLAAVQLPGGSSPLVRGGQHKQCRCRRRNRLIPARAGRTWAAA